MSSHECLVSVVSLTGIGTLDVAQPSWRAWPLPSLLVECLGPWCLKDSEDFLQDPKEHRYLKL